MEKQFFILTLILSALLMLPPIVYAEHVFKNVEAFAQYLDISQLESEKTTFIFDEKSYDVYYGYHGSLDAMGSGDLSPALSSMSLNEEEKSLELIMEVVPEKTDFWVRIPEDLLDAEGGNFIVLVDGKNTGYDLMTISNDSVIGFIIDRNTERIEIIGTQVIPEFGSFVILFLIVSMIGLIYMQKSFFKTNFKTS